MDRIPKISALVICYKQERLIRRAIDSLLNQKEYLYEICISDDCSPDNTWQVIQEYSTQHPGLFKIHQNNPNLGIFKNVENSWSMPTGDLVYQLSGDDECPNGWFKSIVKYINDNNIDIYNKKVCIYGDVKCLYPNGDYFISSNKMAACGFDLVSLTMRGLICNRSACYSTSIMKMFQKVSKGRSYVVEWAQEIELPYFTEESYYIHQLGNIYYTQIGVNIHFSDKILSERVDNFPYMKECLGKFGYNLHRKDDLFITLQKMKFAQITKWNFKRFIKIQYYKVMSQNSDYGLISIKVRHFKRKIFAVLRRLPHAQPIIMKL